MKECLQCKIEFESKRDAGKFCSPKCRVKWHRKNPTKENKLDKVQVQVLYNYMLDILSNFKQPQINEVFKPDVKSNYDAPPLPKNYFKDEPKQWQESKKVKSLMDYVNERIECDCQESYNKWLTELESDMNLTRKQKELAKTAQPN